MFISLAEFQKLLDFEKFKNDIEHFLNAYIYVELEMYEYN